MVFWGVDYWVVFGFYETQKFLCDGGTLVGGGATTFLVSSAVLASALVFFLEVMWSVVVCQAFGDF